MNYNFNDNTLLHSVMFNPFKLESILQNGIMSFNEASKSNFSFTRNTFGYNFDDYISMTRYMYVSFGDKNTSFYNYTLKGITLIVEDQVFIYNHKDMYFNYPDEVFVKDKVDKENIKGILLPLKYLDYLLEELPMFNLKSTSYVNIKHTCDDLINYLKTLNYDVNMPLYNIYLNDLYQVILKLQKDENNSMLLEEFMECKISLNEFIAKEVQNAFDKKFNKNFTTLEEMATFIAEKYNKKIYYIDNLKYVR
ncbi:MAG: hypothetical protein MR297_02460 [Tenericutes bacterium]|nr:hypothetical protein [Mycoplasmatota bacterium]